MNLPPKKDPGTGEALLVFAAFVCVASYFLIPAEKLHQLSVILPSMETLGTLILIGIIYGAFAVGSWVHHNLMLKTPGKTISALKEQSQNHKRLAIRFVAVLMVAISISAFLTSLLSFQSKLLAYTLG